MFIVLNHQVLIVNMIIIIKNLKSFCGKRDAFDRQSKDPGSNPGTVESVLFQQKGSKFNLICIIAI